MASALTLALAACNSGTDGTGPGADRPVGLGFQIARTSSASALAAAGVSADGSPFTGEAPVVTPTLAGLQIMRDTDVILVTKAQLVVKDVKLKTLTASCLDDDADDDNRSDSGPVNADGKSGSSSHDDDDDGCAEMHLGPVLVNMPVTGLDGARVTVDVPPGTYTSVRLSLHKVTSNDGADALFRQTYPDFRDISVRLEGTYNGTPFIFINDVNAKIEVPLESPLVVGAGGDDVTVLIDLSSWFLRPQGGLYAPSLANTPGSVRAAVQNNIRAAFRAFRDHDRDGRKD